MSRSVPQSQIYRVLTRITPSAYLLLAQILLLILYAAFDGQRIERALISVFGVVVLVLRVWVIQRSPATNWIAWVLAIPTLVLSLLSGFVDNPILIGLSAMLDALLYFYAAGSLIISIMNDYEVTVDELFTAAATFTLLAWGYAYLFLMCQMLVPGSFVKAVNPENPLTFIELLFLSFTNLSATGLGDILPVSPWARVVAMLEQFTGVGYVAVVVSRLVGLTLQRSGREHSK
jgi:hypothetical protein